MIRAVVPPQIPLFYFDISETVRPHTPGNILRCNLRVVIISTHDLGNKRMALTRLGVCFDTAFTRTDIPSLLRVGVVCRLFTCFLAFL